ncbi:MAG: efflux RND transporter permease subunit, partial [Selenomonadaceae bacterium]|nr:efflux RND transporter permease subunit [Selenomonadaceae bacterium]
YMQIGLLVLIALAAKNAILIVEVAKVKVDGGEDIERAAVDAATERLRPILMTSLAFVVACVPLMLATGAGSAARNSMGAAVVGGMTIATLLGIFVVPILFACVVLPSFGSKRK